MVVMVVMVESKRARRRVCNAHAHYIMLGGEQVEQSRTGLTACAELAVSFVGKITGYTRLEGLCVNGGVCSGCSVV